ALTERVEKREVIRTTGSRRWLALATALAAVLVPLSVAAPARADAGPGAASPNSATEAAFVAKINALRSSKGVGPLAVDGELTSVAREWAAHMAAAGAISHRSNLAAGITANWGKLGENVGMGPDADGLFQAFVNSPHHYENLVDPAFTRVGVGVAVVNGTIFTAHEFMAVRGAPSPAPRPAAAPVRTR